MEILVMNEAYIFFGTVIGGVLMGVVYDILKSFKNPNGTDLVIIGIFDIITCTVMSALCFLIIYYLNDGRIRWYEMIGIIIGFVLYMMTIEKYVAKFINQTKNALKALIKCILTPIIALLKLFKMPYRKVKNMFKKVKKSIKSVQFKQNLKIKQIKYIFKKIWLYFLS